MNRLFERLWTNRARMIGIGVLFSIGLPLSGAPIRSDFPWQEWGEGVFEQAKRENKFVLLSLQAWWCEPCDRMNTVTYDDSEVRKIIDQHFVPVYVDQDSRPDLSQRFERWGWPATVIFGSDGTEIVKLRGFYSPKFFIPVLSETIRDPSPVDYGRLGGPERPLQLTTQLPDERRDFLIDFFQNKAYDSKHDGWGTRTKLIDGPTLEYAFERARRGDPLMTERLLKTLDKMTTMIDPQLGAMSKLARVDWSKPFREYPMFAQQAALTAYSLAAAQFNEPRYRSAADKVYSFLRDIMSAPEGGLYASMGKEDFNPGVDQSLYSRETGQGIIAILHYYNLTLEREVLDLAVKHTSWALAKRRIDSAGFSHSANDQGGPFLADNIEMARALLQLHHSTGERKWLEEAMATGQFIAANFVDPQTGGFFASAKPAQAFMRKPIKQMEDNVSTTRFFNLLAAYTGNAEFRELAQAGMGYLTSEAVLEAFWYLPGVLQTEHELRYQPTHVTVVGAKDDPVSAALFAAAIHYPAIHKRTDWWDKREGPLANANVSYPDLGYPAAFACSGSVCSLPIREPQEVAKILREFAGSEKISSQR